MFTFQEPSDLPILDQNFTPFPCEEDQSDIWARSLIFQEEPVMQFTHEELENELSPFLTQEENNIRTSFGDFLNLREFYQKPAEEQKPQEVVMESTQVTEALKAEPFVVKPTEGGKDTITSSIPSKHTVSKTTKYISKGSNSRLKAKKATFADRRDVVYKCLIKAVRTTLIEQFREFTQECEFSNSTKGCQVFKAKLTGFLSENPHFLESVGEIYGDDLEEFTKVFAIF